MERAGFEIQDVEAWRLHYARTCKLWCERLTAERETAIGYVGEEKYRIWVAYLAGVSLAFSRGTLRIFQTLVSKSAKRPPALPPTARRPLPVKLGGIGLEVLDTSTPVAQLRSVCFSTQADIDTADEIERTPESSLRRASSLT